MLFLLTALMACVVSNQAAVILVWPVVRALTVPGLSDAQLTMSVLLGASAAFVTPMGNQGSLMILGPGGYASRDFYRIGSVLLAVLTVCSALLVYYVIE